MYRMCNSKSGEVREMTQREKAIVEAFTGVAMLTGEDVTYFYEYVQEIMGRPVYTHEFADAKVMGEIKEKSRHDFVMICKKKESDSRMVGMVPTFEERESVMAVDYANGTGRIEKNKYADWMCPVCGWPVGEVYIPRMHSQQKSDYCRRCGQAIDWTKISREEMEKARRRFEERNKNHGKEQ